MKYYKIFFEPFFCDYEEFLGTKSQVDRYVTLN